MNMEKYLLIIFLLIFTICNAQMYERKKNPLVSFNGSYSMESFYLSPGLTYMHPYKINKLVDNIDVVPRGRLAYVIEAGAYKLFEKGGNIFNYMDYGFSYKKLSGSEIDSINNKSIFKQRYLSANFNVNNIWQISNKKFIQSSIGSNLDFKLFEKGSPEPKNTERLILSFHVKFGYGFKVQKKFFIIPTIESPFLTLKKWEQGKSSYGVFNSRYRPLIFKIRFIWLKTPGKGDCPPVLTNPEDKARYERNYMQ